MLSTMGDFPFRLSQSKHEKGLFQRNPNIRPHICMDRAEGRNADALALLRQAADQEDKLEKHPVTPGPIMPARELLGDLLMELTQPAAALKEYETSQKSEPNRFRNVYCAARAAELAGDLAKAKTYYSQLMKLGAKASGDREELRQARSLLARN